MRGYTNLYFISVLLSLGLYYYAPSQVNYSFQIICFLLFLVQAIAVIKDDIKRDGILNFNLLFLFSFFLVSYAFPLFMMSLTMIQQEGIEAYIDFNVSGKCSALCTLAISLYCCGYKKKYRKPIDLSKIVKSNKLLLINALFIVVFFVLLYITVDYMRTVGDIAVDSGFWYSLFLASLPTALVYNTKKSSPSTFVIYLEKNAIVLLPTLILVILYFLIGDRGLIILSTLEIVAVYHLMVKRIRPLTLIIGALIGASIMFIIRETRSSDNSLGSGNTSAFVKDAGKTMGAAGFLSVFSDLTGIHRELYLGYEYVQANGLVEPAQIVIVPFYPIPLVPNFMSTVLFGKTQNDIKPGLILNDYMEYSGHGHFGIHCVIDVYMRWGLIGIIVFFYFWGYLVAGITSSRNRSLLSVALYVTIIASAISLPRQPLLDMLRTLSYVIIIAWFATFFSNKRTRRLSR